MSFALNSRALNRAQINGAGNPVTSISGAGALAFFAQSVRKQEAAGSFIPIEQTIGIKGSGALTSIEQSINLLLSGSGALSSIDQEVRKTQPGGSLVSVEQHVRSPTIVKPDFELVLTIGGRVIDNGQVFGSISIDRKESNAATMTVTLIPEPGAQNLVAYQGKDVRLNAILRNGSSHRVYTGKVNIPEIDLIGKRITLRCTDNRAELNNGLSRTVVDSIGSYSEAVFSKSDDQHEEIQKRLETVEASLDYDAYGLPYLTSWKPKAVADFTLDDASIYRRDPEISIASRSRIINRVDIELELQYQRLHHRERSFSFDVGQTACQYAVWGLPPSTQMLRSAIESAGWAYTDLQITGLDPSGSYNCYGSTVFWSTKSGTSEATKKLDEDGNVVTDSFGNEQYDVKRLATIDVKSAYANSAIWKAAKRFAQNVSEKITLSIQSPDSIIQYGEVKQEAAHGVTSDYDPTGFEELEAYSAPWDSMTQSSNGDWVQNADSEGTTPQDYRDMVICAIDRAVTKIRGSHRDNRVTLEIPFNPAIDLRHTIETTAGIIQCKGKVASVKHFMEAADKYAYTEIEIALSRVDGSFVGDGSVTLNRPAMADPVSSPSTIAYGAKVIAYGGEQNPDWNGYIFKTLLERYPIDFRTPVALIIDTPEIDAESRETKELTASQSEQVGIRNDSLEVVF